MKKFLMLLLFVILSCACFATGINTLKTGICRIVTDQSIGTGFICGDQNTIITAGHVVEGAKYIELQFKGGSTINIKQVFINSDSDSAVIKMNRGWNSSKHFVFKPAKSIKLGEPVHYYGFKFGNPNLYEKHGYIESLPYKSVVDQMSEFICVDGGVTPGYSGSAVLNKKEEVIGIMSRFYPTDPTSSYVVPLFKCFRYICLF